MDKSVRPSLCRQSLWHQYDDVDDALADQKSRIRRLVRRKRLHRENVFDDCGRGRCGMGHQVPPHRDSSPDPFQCSAFCRIAQVRLEYKEVPRLAKILSTVDANPLFVTLVNPHYWCAVERLPQFNPSGLIQSTKRRLKRVSAASPRPIAAVGRIDFDLGIDIKGNILVRPHVHLIIVGSDVTTLKNHLRPRFSKAKYPNFTPVKIKLAKDIGALRYTLKCRLNGLSNRGNAPLANKHSRQRSSSFASESFDNFLAARQIRDVLIFYGLRRNGSMIEIISDRVKLKAEIQKSQMYNRDISIIT